MSTITKLEALEVPLMPHGSYLWKIYNGTASYNTSIDGLITHTKPGQAVDQHCSLLQLAVNMNN